MSMPLIHRLALILCLGLASFSSISASDEPTTYVTKDRPCYVPVDHEVDPANIIRSDATIAAEVGDYPDSYDIRNISGRNYASFDRNQHIPQYCGSCWGHAAISSLSDRYNLAQKDVWPRINLAVQELINCGGGGSCYGGSSGAAFSYMKGEGIADETCNPYQAQNLPDCDPKCKTCTPDGNCTAITGYHKYGVEKHGEVFGEHAMMKQIYEHGPIACTIGVTRKFEEYTGGVFKEITVPIPNHVVAVSGWGVTADGEKFWYVRNSWGKYWGEDGWFRIIRGNPFEDLGIDDGCAYAIPKL